MVDVHDHLSGEVVRCLSVGTWVVQPNSLDYDQSQSDYRSVRKLQLGRRLLGFDNIDYRPALKFPGFGMRNALPYTCSVGIVPPRIGSHVVCLSLAAARSVLPWLRRLERSLGCVKLQIFNGVIHRSELIYQQEQSRCRGIVLVPHHILWLKALFPVTSARRSGGPVLRPGHGSLANRVLLRAFERGAASFAHVFPATAHVRLVHFHRPEKMPPSRASATRTR